MTMMLLANNIHVDTLAGAFLVAGYRLGRQTAALAMDRVKIRDATAVGRVLSQQVTGAIFSWFNRFVAL